MSESISNIAHVNMLTHTHTHCNSCERCSKSARKAHSILTPTLIRTPIFSFYICHFIHSHLIGFFFVSFISHNSLGFDWTFNVFVFSSYYVWSVISTNLPYRLSFLLMFFFSHFWMALSIVLFSTLNFIIMLENGTEQQLQKKNEEEIINTTANRSNWIELLSAEIDGINGPNTTVWRRWLIRQFCYG